MAQSLQIAFGSMPYPETLRPLTANERPEDVGQARELERGVQAVLAPVAETPGGFRPTLTVARETCELPLIDAAMRCYLDVVARHPRARFLSVNPYGDPDYGAPVLGRVFAYVYPLDESRDLLVYQWVEATGTHLHRFALALLPTQTAAVYRDMMQVMGDLRRDGEGGRFYAQACAPSRLGIPQDNITHHGPHPFPIEDLSAVRIGEPRKGQRADTEAHAAAVQGVTPETPTVMVVNCGRVSEIAQYRVYESGSELVVVRNAGRNAYHFALHSFESYRLDRTRLLVDFFDWLQVRPRIAAGDRLIVEYPYFQKCVETEAGPENWHCISRETRMVKWDEPIVRTDIDGAIYRTQAEDEDHFSLSVLETADLVRMILDIL